MGVSTSEVGYTIATTRRENHEGHKKQMVALGRGGLYLLRGGTLLFESYVITRSNFDIGNFHRCKICNINYHSTAKFVQEH